MAVEQAGNIGYVNFFLAFYSIVVTHCVHSSDESRCVLIIVEGDIRKIESKDGEGQVTLQDKIEQVSTEITPLLRNVRDFNMKLHIIYFFKHLHSLLETITEEKDADTKQLLAYFEELQKETRVQPYCILTCKDVGNFNTFTALKHCAKISLSLGTGRKDQNLYRV